MKNKLLIIEKKGVVHKFVPILEPGYAKHFIENDFKDWDDEQFDLFEKAKDREGIAIDLGAWLGTTAIWLSKNFYHVVAVEADKLAVQYLKMNLEASGCTNTTVCERPISHYSQPVIFGAIGDAKTDTLNTSLCHMKEVSNNESDFIVNSITFQELLDETIYSNPQIRSRKISLIKCDIEGAEEEIFEEIFQFAKANRCNVCMSFHLSWWKSKNINDYDAVFEGFTITANPETSVLFFEPKHKQ